ncbi:MAG: hypothetical protein ACD_24C00313G0001 [uncultured bacterium]|uniref:Uncharacterized protein n=1 Tax=candidate division WWE3 bacterium TaxID=2053526 RepID=A0A656PN63_UNCKA|nr:MAG: hypothetical protein ACD_24C00313G0001 [uncultured bacterium]KKS28948.1 MAG: hypothetical protein UU91_C0011G0002 [candidate division WWE3 bacterium GW2011_GWB1_42_117]KKS54493.1 MAG: hypothetical protein UV21_C0007G0002 [candidate division WWE3 bacterium GW2011_GWD2_42_34]KKT05451.1 MAG: hypothetical protein UV83_C0003G0006 [candidate division WWE3 bacterium GW2011_GWE2_43_18]KKT06796.1 MAG: hypothetical protein UV84_C0004G0084 [candidate division WWE3 bacterium GW2011_GWF2_43_18]KKT0
MINLKCTDFLSVECSTNAIGLMNTNKLLSLIKESNYKYIIGLGIYASKNNVIKIEKKATNHFRNEKAIKKAPNYYDIGEFIKIEDMDTNFVISDKMGNSWCNMTAFVIRDCLNRNNISALNGFIHIPNEPENLPVYQSVIQNVLNSIKSSN